MRYFIEVSYDGTAFKGSQIQKELPTVQLALNQAIQTVLREDICTFGASRTDEGVHAFCNFYHFDTDKKLDHQFVYKLNAILPFALSIQNMFVATDPELNARFAALSRQYRYRIYFAKNPFLFKRALYFPFEINKEILHQTAAILKEYNDFETFCKRNAQTFTYNCNIIQSYWVEKENELQYIVEANRFLRGMVRALVGTQLQVARGRISLQDFRSIIESKDCTKADFSVTGNGLYLEKISYPENTLVKIKGRRD